MYQAPVRTDPQLPNVPVTPELYVEVQLFYARQMPLLDARQFEDFLDTFTEDGIIEHVPYGWRLEGRDHILREMRDRRGDPDKPRVGPTSPRRARKENIPYYNGIVYRYWFDKLHIEPLDNGDVRTAYQAMVSMTERSGRVNFEPTTRVTDLLVRRNGQLRTRSRVIVHDTAHWADEIHNKS